MQVSPLSLRGRIDLLLRGGELAIFHEFHKPPYGGGNQFLLALKAELERQGLRVSRNRVGSNTRCVLFNSFNFDFDEVRQLRKRSFRMVHRVDGPIGVYRGSDLETDEKIFRINQEVADATVFQSRYSYQKHLELGFEFKNAVVLTNAVDASYFYPVAAKSSPAAPRLKVVGSAWSNNPKKGLATYEWLDRHLDHSRFELTFIGRTQGEFKNIRTIGAVPSQELGELLRQQDVYLAPSENDPCSNALIEALACGLPSVYRKSGGHPELVGEGGLGFDSPEEIPNLLEKIRENWETYRRKIRVATIAEIATGYRKVMEL